MKEYNIRKCEKEFRRGIRVGRKNQGKNLYSLQVNGLYVPKDESELASFCAGLDFARKERG